MNTLVRQYLYEDADFDEVLVLSEGPEKSWSEIENLLPDLPRGWYELSRIPSEDRLEFTHSYWLRCLPFHPKTHQALSDFFNSLDDVAVVSTKKNDEWLHQLIYSFEDNSCFFRGLAPAKEEEIEDLKRELKFSFPSDWISFVKIHNGFGKLSEIELVKVEDVPDERRKLLEMMLKAPHTIKSGSLVVDPGTFVPFFESSGLSAFQCFYADWYPGSEMGNLYFSGLDYTVSDLSRRENWEENGAFPTFLEWLASYLEGMEIAPSICT